MRGRFRRGCVIEEVGVGVVDKVEKGWVLIISPEAATEAIDWWQVAFGIIIMKGITCGLSGDYFTVPVPKAVFHRSHSLSRFHHTFKNYLPRIISLEYSGHKASNITRVKSNELLHTSHTPPS